MTKRLAALVMLLLFAVARTGAAAPQDDRGVRQLLDRLETATRAGRQAGYFELLAETADRRQSAAFYETELTAGASRVVIIERDRVARPEGGLRIVVDALLEYGARGRAATWQFDLVPVSSDWRIAMARRVSSAENIYRLSITGTKEYVARNLTVRADDLTLTLTDGYVFTIDTDEGETGLVFVGQGRMRFSPTPPTEKGQVRIFCGADALDTPFTAAYIRLGDLDAHLDRAALAERPVDPGHLRRAQEVFKDESPKTYVLDLDDLTRDTWSLTLGPKDFVAEIRTRRYDTLTYVRASDEPEDIALFDRRRQTNIAMYASAEKLATRGPFYNEDSLAPYDVLHYDVDAAVAPDRQWISGQTTMRVRIGSRGASQLTVRLAETLVLRSVTSSPYGHLFGVRAKGQGMVLVNLPGFLPAGTELTLTLAYDGKVPPDTVDREIVRLGGQDPQVAGPDGQPLPFPPTPSVLYSNHSYWYAQAPWSDYATAVVQITVSEDYECVASGERDPGSPILVDASGELPAVKIYTFRVTSPVRYLSVLATRLQPADHRTVEFEDGSRALDLTVEANPRRVADGRETGERLTDITRFYQSLTGEAPYPTLTLALVEGLVPSGHSPAYFAMVMKPPPGAPDTWREDPAAFRGYPEFVMAHEVAHQWWGQAVGLGNYHEQWLSEGFAQYLAALYAQHAHGDAAFRGMMRQMRKWALDESDQGPVYLGYRLGHVKREGRVFRALVYDKGAVVLHMLRRLVGDEAFFRGLRLFYTTSRFTKVGTDDLRRAMEVTANRPLDRFFERWIYGSTLPRVTYSWHVETDGSGQALALRFDQAGEEIFDLPVTVRLQYADRRTVEVMVPVTERTTETRLPLDGTLKSVEIDTDDGTLADVRKGS